VNMHRRTFLKGTLGAATLTVAAAAGLLTPTRVLAAAWPKPAFEAKSMDDVAKALYGNAAGAASKDISIKAPIQAENGAVVPIAVSTKLSWSRKTPPRSSRAWRFPAPRAISRPA